MTIITLGVNPYKAGKFRSDSDDFEIQQRRLSDSRFDIFEEENTDGIHSEKWAQVFTCLELIFLSL